MRRSRTVAVVAAAGLAALAVTAPATARGGRTLHLEATTVPGYPVLVDVSGNADPTPGDQDVGDSLVLLNTLEGRGTDGSSRSAGQFTMVEPSTGLRLATVALMLDDGQVTLSGFVRLSQEENTLAVTGGTGRYRNVRGEMTFDRKQGPVNHYTLTLLG